MTRLNYTSVTLALAAGFAALVTGCGSPAANTPIAASATPVAASPVAKAAETPASKPANLAGSYEASGSNPNGAGNYTASLVVTPRDDVFQFSWSSSGRAYDGIGVLTDDTVAVSYTDGNDGKGCGVVLYKVGQDGTLDGKYGYWGVNTAQTEKAKRTSGSTLEGKYQTEGTNPNGSKYQGTLDVTKDGEGYAFAWDGGSTSTGFGVQAGDKLAIGFGGRQCAFVSYTVKPDGTLDGKWGQQGSKSFGTEVAKKK